MIDRLDGKYFVICIDNTGSEASLEQWKVYPALMDEEAACHNEIRVIDEEGEDYLYPSDRFAPVSLNPDIARIFVSKVPVTQPCCTVL